MTRSFPTASVVRGLVVTLGVALAAALAVAESHEVPKVGWDQRQVSAIAARLTDHTYALYDDFQKAPESTLGSGYARAYHELKHKLRRIKVEARHLSAQLESGRGEVETFAAYHHLAEMFADARDLAQKIFVWKGLKIAAAKVREDLNALAPFYGGRRFEPLEL